MLYEIIERGATQLVNLITLNSPDASSTAVFPLAWWDQPGNHFCLGTLIDELYEGSADFGAPTPPPYSRE